MLCTCLATGYCQAILYQVKVVFIPMHSRNSYCGPRDKIWHNSGLLLAFLLDITPWEDMRCGTEAETSVHILCEWEALASCRHANLGSFFLDPEDKAQNKGSLNYFEEHLGRSYVFNEIRDEMLCCLITVWSLSYKVPGNLVVPCKKGKNER